MFIAGSEPVRVSPLTEFAKERSESQAIKIAVDSSNINLDDGIESTKATLELFEELGLDPLYMDTYPNDGRRKRSTPEAPSSSIFD